MKKRLRNEADILDPAFRKKVIEEITGAENVRRKNAALRAFECYKGNTKKWVVEQLSHEFDEETVVQMQSRATNISVLRKVANKLGQTYTNGVDRTLEDDDSTPDKPSEAKKAIDEMSKAVCLNKKQEKADRYYEVFRNALVQIIPTRNFRESEEGGDKYDLSVRVLPPHFYDVIEDDENPEVARVVILTEFTEKNTGEFKVLASETGRESGAVSLPTAFDKGDGIEQTIAESPDDDAGRQNREFIWWSDNYHFTTDKNGVLIKDKSPDDNANPIARLPFVFYAGDQDGSFFADGWQDKVDGAILINVALTDMHCIAMVQGWGQPVITGEKLPGKVKGGPHRAIMLKQETGSPESKFYYATSNPPLDQWMRMIELQCALYLSTNNLSPTTVAAKLDVQTMASGIAMMIERSESTADIQDKQGMFAEGEPETFMILAAWQKTLSERGELTEKFAQLPQIENVQVVPKFHTAKPVISEKEKMETIEAKKKTGLFLMKDLLKELFPELTDEAAIKKIKELLKEKQMLADMFAPEGGDNADQKDGEDASAASEKKDDAKNSDQRDSESGDGAPKF